MGVSDAVLDACLVGDPKCKVACETASKDNMVMVFGEITTSAKLDYDSIVRKAVKEIGYDSYEEALDSVDSKGISDKTCEVLVRINKRVLTLQVVFTLARTRWMWAQGTKASCL